MCLLFSRSSLETVQKEDYIHHFSQESDTGLNLDLQQEYALIALDIFQEIVHNKYIRNLYGEIYELCRNIEKVMEMFSKELQELDRNTVQYMIDEMQEEIDEQKKRLDEKDKEIAKLKKLLSES